MPVQIVNNVSLYSKYIVNSVNIFNDIVFIVSKLTKK